MVFLNVMKNDRMVFLYHTTTDTPIDKAMREATQIWNDRIRLSWFVTCSKTLLKEHQNQSCNQLQQAMLEADTYLNEVTSGKPRINKPEELEGLIQNIQGAVKIAYVEEASDLEKLNKQLGDLDVDTQDQMRKQMILNVVAEANVADANEMLDPATTVCWACGKRWDRSEPVSKYTGRNEKTTMKIKLTEPNAGAPARSPPISQKEQGEMLEWWHKKQEREKIMAQDDDLSYANGTWADSKQLSNHLQGLSDVKLPPGKLA
eukprot:NODE_1033_length_1044_cov_138.172301_g989_i0.p1 GENE.NODE_1033_length_1044_cov_138.172301_g989_i0~~NODE_1033_length_1044_cov_138.172301_g989_i0.p1  ORF type:complete len:261 (+),score=42.23 NODE_1033_length_1044_cov_138.172301_g989_i0:164-946(+)